MKKHKPAYCAETKDHKHRLRSRYAQPVDGIHDGLLITVECKMCGRSGSLRILETDVNWREANEE